MKINPKAVLAILILGIVILAFSTSNLGTSSAKIYIYIKSLLLNGKSVQLNEKVFVLPSNWAIYEKRGKKEFSLVHYSSPTNIYNLVNLDNEEIANFSTLFRSYKIQKVKNCEGIYQVESNSMFYFNNRLGILIGYKNTADNKISELCKWLNDIEKAGSIQKF